jgi:hypothetical protein
MVITVGASKMTARVLAKAMRAALKVMRGNKSQSKSGNNSNDGLKPGKVSVKELSANSKDGLQKIPITDDNIKAFDPVARKYGITYALAKDESDTPPKWAVFFRAKDSEVLGVAFAEFSKKVLSKEKETPSVLDKIKKPLEQTQTRTRDRQKVRERSNPEH